MRVAPNILIEPPKCFVLLLALLCASCSPEGFRLGVVFPEAYGIKKGADVRYRGVNVGKVDGVELRGGPNGTPTDVVVNFHLSRKDLQLRQDDEFWPETAELLGDGYLEIRPGPSASPALTSGSVVRGIAQRTLRIEDLPSYLELMAIAVKLNSLAPDRRREVVARIRELVAQASSASGTTSPRGGAPR